MVELPELSAQALAERMVSVVTHTLSEPENASSNKEPYRRVKMTHAMFGSPLHLGRQR